MKRFKNIVMVYDLVPGCDETLARAEVLAARNQAHLTVVHAVNPLTDEQRHQVERERMVRRITNGLRLPKDRKSHIVRLGSPAECILNVASEIRADLIVTPDSTRGFYSRLVGLGVPAELLRRAECPVWIVRPQQVNFYRRIVAAVNAGKPDALECPSNRRILEVASSLSALEHAELHIAYAWDFEGAERDMMMSELPRGKRSEMLEEARLMHLGLVVDLVTHVLGDFKDYTPVPLRGNPRDSIVNYIQEQGADLLVIDGKVQGAMTSVFLENTTSHLIHESTCSVLFTRPAPAYRSDRKLEVA